MNEDLGVLVHGDQVLFLVYYIAALHTNVLYICITL